MLAIHPLFIYLHSFSSPFFRYSGSMQLIWILTKNWKIGTRLPAYLSFGTFGFHNFSTPTKTTSSQHKQVCINHRTFTHTSSQNSSIFYEQVFVLFSISFAFFSRKSDDAGCVLAFSPLPSPLTQHKGISLPVLCGTAPGLYLFFKLIFSVLQFTWFHLQ